MFLTDLSDNKKIEVDNGLYVVSTPIGNKYDITIRALYILNSSSVIICEDTRVTKKLFNILELNIKSKMWISYNDYNANKKIELIIDQLKKDRVVSLVSDAGTPLLSDPGYKLIRATIKHNFKITPVPGASAITASLMISGAKTDKFSFLGFLPKSKKKFVEILYKYSSLKTTLIIFESANRIKTLIENIFYHFKYANLIITRELTKLHEEVIYIDITNFEKYIRNDFHFKGEITVALELNQKENGIDYSDKELLEKLKKFKPSKVAAMLAKSSALTRDEIYKRCIDLVK